jgi:uncharacterized protein (DUF433 family)
LGGFGIIILLEDEDMSTIVSTKSVLGGKPRISGTRISIDVIADYISAGYGVRQIRGDYPHLTKEQIDSALSYIEKRVAQERVRLEPKTS